MTTIVRGRTLRGALATLLAGVALAAGGCGSDPATQPATTAAPATTAQTTAAAQRAGSTYSGTTSDGQTIAFPVSADGGLAGPIDIAYTQVCNGGPTMQDASLGPFPIEGGRFANGSVAENPEGFLAIAGTFVADGTATGTLLSTASSDPGKDLTCEAVSVSWSARSDAP